MVILVGVGCFVLVLTWNLVRVRTPVCVSEGGGGPGWDTKLILYVSVSPEGLAS